MTKAQTSAATPVAAVPKRRASKETAQVKAGAPEAIAATAPPTAVKGKLGALVTLLSRAEGATIAAMIAATGWQAHSVRGALSGSLKKKLGLNVTSSKDESGRVYRIAADNAA